MSTAIFLPPGSSNHDESPHEHASTAANMLVLLLSVLFALTVLCATTKNPIVKHVTPTIETNAAIFGAVGSVIGYFGIEIGSDALFERLLWPTRFYNTSRLSTLLQIAFLTPMGGPLLRPAIRVLDEFVQFRLLRGTRQGDMGGTAFFRNLEARCIVHQPKNMHNPDIPGEFQMRNMLWIRALRATKMEHSLRSTADVESAKRIVKEVSAKRAVYYLTIEPMDAKPSKTQDKGTVDVSGDVGKLHIRTIIGVIASEAFALGVGTFVAIKYRSLYATLFFLPLLLKLISLLTSVRRQNMIHPNSGTMTEHRKVTAQLKNVAAQPVQDTCLYELARTHDSSDFLLIKAPNTLLHQFFHHYGHPLRTLKTDRAREIISILLVGSFALLFPASLLLSIWADPRIQWIWLAYEAYATLAMYIFRFWGGELVGSTEGEVAKGLEQGRQVRFVDAEGKGVVARLKCYGVGDVREGVEKVGELMEGWE